MKVLFFTDIHGSLSAMCKVKRVIDDEKPDKVVFLGDLLYHGPRNPLPDEYAPLKVAEHIASLDCPTVLVKGNCDSEVDEMVIGKKFVSRYTVHDHGKKVICTHGHKLDRLNTNGAFAVIYGHFHVNEVTKKDGVYFVNIASVSLPKNNATVSFAKLENGIISVMDFDGNVLSEIK